MSQSGKTLNCFVIPTLHTAVAKMQDALIGVPEADMASDKWDKDFVPTLTASDELAWLLPEKGPGSKGGRVKDRITLNSGVDIKIMSRGGEDTNKAGWTAQTVSVTELKGWGGKQETSSEATDLKKLIARMRSFKRKFRRIIGEGTCGTPEELPWSLRGGDDPDDPVISTRSRIVAPCPHCGDWICPERRHLVGWQDARSVVEAEDKAHFVCPTCGGEIWDDARRLAMQDCQLLHAGQTIDKGGEIHGDPPPTKTLFFQWGCFHNCLLDASDTAVDEYKASLLDEGTAAFEDAERELTQFGHGIPFISALIKNTHLDSRKIRRRVQGSLSRGWVHDDTMFVVIAVDPGKYTAWWLAVAFRACGQWYTPAYGAFDVCRPGMNDDEGTRLQMALAQFDEEVVQEGFYREGNRERVLPATVGVDMNYLPDSVAAFVVSLGGGADARWRCIRGRGKSVEGNNAGYHHPRALSTGGAIEIGTQWFAEANYSRGVVEYTMNADHWVDHMQDRLRIEPGNKGAWTFYRPTNTSASSRPRKGGVGSEHAKLSNHLAADQKVEEWDPDKRGLVLKRRKVGENHWGDCGKICGVFGDRLGFRLEDIEVPEPVVEAEPKADNWFARRLGL